MNFGTGSPLVAAACCRLTILGVQGPSCLSPSYTIQDCRCALLCPTFSGDSHSGLDALMANSLPIKPFPKTPIL